jgi:hypothetical protein
MLTMEPIERFGADGDLVLPDDCLTGPAAAE